ncbi:hypothetical protein RFI_27312 [Reticulomyxa filosa]|uniref:RING-type domain-containing protein n=1 Tax=Reticulomyxa filosa TaxID=46433 RepID=X6M9B1_RETFI|nr:hypothetical protein RFI_27312 [Reticulomyxa filosa]|eukprot:ETO10067.1 hypothetical protein RFI_27312 [Reticulomyxa filosa]
MIFLYAVLKSGKFYQKRKKFFRKVQQGDKSKQIYVFFCDDFFFCARNFAEINERFMPMSRTDKSMFSIKIVYQFEKMLTCCKYKLIKLSLKTKQKKKHSDEIFLCGSDFCEEYQKTFQPSFVITEKSTEIQDCANFKIVKNFSVDCFEAKFKLSIFFLDFALFNAKFEKFAENVSTSGIFTKKKLLTLSKTMNVDTVPRSQESNVPMPSKFMCDYCKIDHWETDLFLWSGCQHKMSRECAYQWVERAFNEEKLPCCSVKNCEKQLKEAEACLLLNDEELTMLLSLSLQSMAESNNFNSRKGNGVSNPIFGMEDRKCDNDKRNEMRGTNKESNMSKMGNSENFEDQKQEQEEEEDDNDEKKEEEKKSANDNPNSTGTSINLLDKLMLDSKSTFECVECHSTDTYNNAFQWSGCGHEYSKDCAMIAVLQHLTMQSIPCCSVPGCQQLLKETDAFLLLPLSEYSVYATVCQKMGMPPAFSFSKDKDIEDIKQVSKISLPSASSSSTSTSTSAATSSSQSDTSRPNNSNSCQKCSKPFTTASASATAVVNTVRLTACGHEFCQSCIFEAIKRQIDLGVFFPPNCPTCYTNLSDDDVSVLIPQLSTHQGNTNEVEKKE